MLSKTIDRRLPEIIDLKNATRAYFLRSGICVKDDELIVNKELNSNIDISCRNKHFQVKNVPGKDKELFALMEKGRIKQVLTGINGFEDFKEKYIKIPLRKIVSGKNVILLLWCNSPFLCPFDATVVVKIITTDQEIQSLCLEREYDEVLLLDDKTKISVYIKHKY